MINIKIILLYIVDIFRRTKTLLPLDNSASVSWSLERDLSRASLCNPRSDIIASPISSDSAAICVDLKYVCNDYKQEKFRILTKNNFKSLWSRDTTTELKFYSPFYTLCCPF